MEHYITNQRNVNESFNILSQMLKDYINLMNDHDLEGVMAMIHCSSPALMPTRHLLGKLMSTYKLKNELLDIKYIGDDSDYVYIRMKHKTIKLEGPDFIDNITDSIAAMRKDGDVWKIWSMMPLVSNYLNKSS